MASVSTNTPLSMPTQQQPISDPGGLASQPWWRFFLGLYNRSAATIPYLVGSDIIAGGTTQADATPLSSEWNAVSTTPANSGVVLNAFGIGFASTVYNQGAHALNVYPPVGCSIDGGAANAPYSLAAGKSQIFSQLTATDFSSLQLG